MHFIGTPGFFRKRLNKLLLIMKLTLFFIAVCSFQLTASVYSQNTKLSINMENQSLVEVMKEIRNRSEFTFVYDVEDVEGIFIEKVKFNKATVEEILNNCLSETKLAYEVIDNVVILKQAPPKPVLPQEPQKTTIKGKVTDEYGEPLPFVNIYIKGGNQGVITDDAGKYSIAVEEKEGMIMVASFIGFVTEEFTVDGRTEINLMLKADIADLSEIVVTGYQTIAKERATGSFQIVRSDEINNITSLDLSQRLEGVATGVKVNKDGSIIIRGESSINAETDPLIVLNGHPWEGNILEINPDDVEQLTVLKDAASASIYGVRGANGVIVITTKRGKKDGQLSVNYTGTFQVSEKPNLDDLHIMNTRQYVDMEWDAYESAGMGSSHGYNYKSELGEIFAALQAGTITETEAQEMKEEIAFFDNRRDIEDLFFRREMIQKHTVSFDYGTDKNQLYASISFDENKGMWQGVGADNISFNLNERLKYNDLLQLNLSVLGNFRENKNNGQFASMTRPYVRFKDEDGNYVHEAKGSYDAASVKNYESMGLLPFFYNQVQERELKNNKTRRSNISTNTSLDITPYDWMKLTASVGYRQSNGRTENLEHKESYKVREYVNRHTDNAMKQVIPYGNILRYNDVKYEDITTRFQMNLKRQFNDFNVGFNTGFERNCFKRQDNIDNVRYNYHPQRLTESVLNGIQNVRYTNVFNGRSSIRKVPKRVQEERRYQSFFYIGNVSYKGKYDLSGSWRLDKTNLFGQSSEYQDQPSWSIGSKWHFSKETFFNVLWINNLIIKGSYGLAGNVERNTSPYLIADPRTDGFTGEQSLIVSNPENPQLGWEKTYTTNIGIDYSLLNNRIFGSIEYYNKKSEDVLAYVNIDPTTGFGGSSSSKDQVKMNNGGILNRGIDVNIGASVVKQDIIKYDVNLNFSYNKNEITSIDVPAKTRNEVLNGNPVEGQPVNYIYGFRNAGLDENGEPQVYDKNGDIVSWTKMGDFGIEDGKFIGRATPPVYGSLNNHFEYKNLSADIFFLYDFGHFAKQYSYQDPVRNAGKKNIHNIVDQRWRKPGDEAHTKVPKLDNTSYSSYDRQLATWDSDYNIDNADVIQLKSINLSYDFTTLVNVPTIKSLKLKVGVENLWHWTAADNDRIYDNRVNNRELYYMRDLDFPRFKNYTVVLSMKF